MTQRLARSSLVSVLALAAAACAAPSSFDGLSGGARERTAEPGITTRSADAGIAAPRPLSPISVSLVSTLRPRFAWELPEGTTGAVLELCRTRACDGDVRRLEVEGQRVSLDTDLEPGFWFWRLFGADERRVGTTPSPTWELVVRGPAMRGSSDVPAGSVLDINGDGLPDLVVSADEADLDFDTGKEVWRSGLTLFLGTPDGKLVANGLAYLDGISAPGEDALAGGIDTDGDGLSDIAHAIKDVRSSRYAVDIKHGTVGKTWEDTDLVDYIDYAKGAGIEVPDATTLPSIASGGDVNGDGYGDVIVMSADRGAVALGGAKGTATTMWFTGGTPEATASRAVIGGFDADGDGLSDIALAGGPAAAPILAVRGDRMRVDAFAELGPGEMGIAGKPVAFAAGDFDGDGASDVAATIPISGRRHVCLFLAHREKLLVRWGCLPGPADDPAYGDQLASGDLDGSGRDALLVSQTRSSGTAIEALTIDGETLTASELPTTGVGKRLTTIWPGRPGKARWAAVSDDQRSIVVFEGREPLQTIPFVRGDFAAVGFVRAIR